MNTYKITNLGNATSDNDALNRHSADMRYYLTSTPLNGMRPATASVTLNNFKITDLADATLSTDALNR